MEEFRHFTVEEKTKFIKHMFKHYQPTLTVVEQITLLTLWEEVCVSKEEYEMAKTIKEELDFILENGYIPQNSKIIPKKENFFKKIFNKIKKLFNLKSKY